MPKYVAHTRVFLGHENRFVGNLDGEPVEFETTFPKGFKPGGNIELKRAPKKSASSKGDVESGEGDGESTDDFTDDLNDESEQND